MPQVVHCLFRNPKFFGDLLLAEAFSLELVPPLVGTYPRSRYSPAYGGLPSWQPAVGVLSYAQPSSGLFPALNLVIFIRLPVETKHAASHANVFEPLSVGFRAP